MVHQSTFFNQPLLGLWSRRGAPELMDLPHRHNELELNFIERGAIQYLFPSRRIEVPARQLFLFWSAVPHQLVWKAEDTMVNWMTLPLAQVLRWQLPAGFTRLVLQGTPVANQDESFTSGDLAAFQRWHADLLSGEEERLRTLELEVQARLRRLADAPLKELQPQVTASHTGKAEWMAHYLSGHFQEAWRVSDVARAAGLHPNYAMIVFQRAFGVSMVEYATQLKIAMAQQLLVTSEWDIIDIAYECGFGSASRFYAAFKTVTHTTPHAFRESLRWKDRMSN